VLHALLTLASAAPGEEESSKTAFYIAGGALALFAVLISAVGIARHEHFPPSRGVATAVIGLCGVLVAATMATAIITG
jgi:hypothetical protein